MSTIFTLTSFVKAAAILGYQTRQDITKLYQQVFGEVVIAMPDTNLTLDATITPTNQTRYSVLRFTGTLTAQRAAIVENTPRLYTVRNDCNFPINIRTAAGVGFAIPSGQKRTVYVDSSGTCVEALSAFGNTLFTSGATLIGKTTAGSSSIPLEVSNGGVSGSKLFRFDGVTAGGSLFGYSDAGGVGITRTDPYSNSNMIYLTSGNQIQIYCGSTERARWLNSGFAKFSNTGSYTLSGYGDLSTNPSFHYQSDNNNTVCVYGSTSAGGSVTCAEMALPAGSTGYYFKGSLGAVLQFSVASNGNVLNTNNSYGALSDRKLKEDIQDAPNFLDRFMQVRFRKYKLKSQSGSHLGVVAQELESVFPGLVEERLDTEAVTIVDDFGNEGQGQRSVGSTKSVKYSVLSVIQGKVIQEQQDLIDKLATRLDLLEDKLSQHKLVKPSGIIHHIKKLNPFKKGTNHD